MAGSRKADLEEHAQAVRRIALVALATYPSFAAVDVYLYEFLYPQASLSRVFTLRAAGVVVLAVFALWSRFRHRSLFVLDAGIAFAFSLTVAALGMMSPDFGGLDGVYPHGLAFYYVGCSALIPAPWPRMLGILLPIHVSYFATAAVAVLLDPVVTGQWHTPGGVAFFNVHIIMETALLLFATVSGHLLWTSRRQLKEARQLGRYRLTAPLGEGAMNEVWLARDATLGREVALKMLRTDPGVYDDRWIRFEREAHATSTLTSPHTIKIFDYGASDDGIAYIAMEYLRGMDLHAMVRRHGPLDVRRWSTSRARPAGRWARRTGAGWSTATSSRPTCSRCRAPTRRTS